MREDKNDFHQFQRFPKQTRRTSIIERMSLSSQEEEEEEWAK